MSASCLTQRRQVLSQAVFTQPALALPPHYVSAAALCLLSRAHAAPAPVPYNTGQGPGEANEPAWHAGRRAGTGEQAARLAVAGRCSLLRLSSAALAQVSSLLGIDLDAAQGGLGQ